MRKSDLKDGMIVKTRIGGIYLVCGDSFIGIDSIGWNKFENYTEGLKSVFNKYDIVAVYEPKIGVLSDIIANHNFERLQVPVWEEVKA